MKFSQDQIIWIQEWLTKIEEDEEAFFELRLLLFRMKQELADALPSSPLGFPRGTPLDSSKTES